MTRISKKWLKYYDYFKNDEYYEVAIYKKLNNQKVKVRYYTANNSGEFTIENKYILGLDEYNKEEKELFLEKINLLLDNLPKPNSLINKNDDFDPVKLNIEGFSADVDLEEIRIKLLKFYNYKALYEELYFNIEEVLNGFKNNKEITAKPKMDNALARVAARKFATISEPINLG